MPSPLQGLPQVLPRRIVRGTNVQSGTAIAARAAASAFDAVANEAREINQQYQGYRDDQAEQQAREDVADGTGEARRGVLREDRVYNNALRAGLLAQAEVDGEAELQRIMREHQYDAEGFEAAVEDYIGEAVGSEDMPLGVAQDIENRLRLRASRMMSGIEAATQEAAANEAQQSLELSLEQVEREIVTGIEAGGPGWVNSDAGQDAMGRARSIVETLVANPRFAWSDVRGEQRLDAMMRSGEESVMVSDVTAAYERGGELEALQRIDELATQQEMTTQERIAMRSRLTQRVQLLSSQDALRRRQQERAEEQRRERLEGEARAYVSDVQLRVIRGESIDPGEIEQLQRLRQLDLMTDGQYTGIIDAALSTDDVSPDGPSELALLERARDPGLTREELLAEAMMGVASGRVSRSVADDALGRFDALRDDRLGAGAEIIDSYFSQGMFDFSGTREAQRAEATVDLREWVDTQETPPSRPQIEARAREIAMEYGRQTPEPPLPSSVTRPNMFQQVDAVQWARDAELGMLSQFPATDPATWSDEQRLRFSQMSDQIDAYSNWLRIQQDASNGATSATQ